MNKQNSNLKSPREVSIRIWKNIFYGKKKFNYELDNNIYLQSLTQRDKSFVYYLISLCLRKNKQIKKIFSKYLKKEIKKDSQYLSSILMLGTAEILWLRTPDYAILHEYVELTKKLIGKHFSGFINAIFRKVLQNKEHEIKLSENMSVNIPKYMHTQWIKSYGKNTVNNIVNSIMNEPYLDIICSKKTKIKQKESLSLI